MQQTINNVDDLIKKIYDDFTNKKLSVIKETPFYKQIENLINSCTVEQLLNFPFVNPKVVSDTIQSAKNAAEEFFVVNSAQLKEIEPINRLSLVKHHVEINTPLGIANELFHNGDDGEKQINAFFSLDNSQQIGLFLGHTGENIMQCEELKY
jgi:hypothetical protein